MTLASTASKNYKILENEKVKLFRSKEFNYNFNKITGYHEQWGATKEEDSRSPYGPVIADIEVVSMCKGPGGKLCPFCFPAGTKISTVGGDKNIEDVSDGDIVYSVVEETGDVVENIVEELYTREINEDIFIIEVNGVEIATTANHPFFVKNVGWVEAKDLKEDMILLVLNT